MMSAGTYRNCRLFSVGDQGSPGAVVHSDSQWLNQRPYGFDIALNAEIPY